MTTGFNPPEGFPLKRPLLAEAHETPYELSFNPPEGFPLKRPRPTLILPIVEHYVSIPRRGFL